MSVPVVVTYPAMLAVLLLPAAFSTWFRYMTARSKEIDQVRKWIEYRRMLHVLMLLSVPAWWSVFPDGSAQANAIHNLPVCVVFLIPPSGAIFMAQQLAYWSDTRFLERNWTSTNVLRLATWSTLSFAVPLLLLAIGIQSIYDRKFVGILAIVVAGIVALVGTVRLRSAEGFKLQAVKSGEFYKRALVLSKRMGIRLRQVCVVPFGKGRLTNAYGSWDSIAVTDDYGHWLHGAELDFVVGHELAHVKHKHGLRKLLATVAIFGLATAATLLLPHPTGVWRVVSNFAVIIVPLVGLYLLSQRFEYAADQTAVELTGDPEAGIRALTNLYHRTGVPLQRSKFEWPFATHPDFYRRVQAIARARQLSEESVLNLRKSLSRSAGGSNS